MASKDTKPVAPKGESFKTDLVRRFKANPFIFVGTILILIITVIAFVFVPAFADAGGGGSGSLSFGSYDGKPINFMPGNYFAQQRDYYNEQIRSSGSTDNMEFAAFQVWRAAFESTVVRTAALIEMEKAGYTTPPGIVDQKMAQLPVFQENGRFSAARYRALSDVERMELRADLHDGVAMEHYMTDLLGLRTSSKETEFMKKIASPERSFDMVAFPVSSYPDSEVAAFVSSKPELFRVAHLSKITVTSSEGDAKKVLESISKGTTSFEEAAKTYSKDEFADKGGDMGVRYVFELTTEISDQAARDAVLGMEKGKLSAIIKVPAGWALYRSEEATRDPNASDVSVQEKARGYIINFERGRIEDWLFAQAKGFAAQAAADGFQKAALARSLEKKAFGPLGINYGDMELYRSVSSFELPELSGAATNETFWKTAFSTPLATSSEPFMIGDFALVLYPIEEKATDESSSSIIDFYYPYIAGQYAEQSVRNGFLQSDKLKDNFNETFIQTFISDN